MSCTDDKECVPLYSSPPPTRPGLSGFDVPATTTAVADFPTLDPINPETGADEDAL